MSLPSASAQPLFHAAHHAAQACAQTLTELVGAETGQYLTQREIDVRVNSWFANVDPTST